MLDAAPGLRGASASRDEPIIDGTIARDAHLPIPLALDKTSRRAADLLPIGPSREQIEKYVAGAANGAYARLYRLQFQHPNAGVVPALAAAGT